MPDSETCHNDILVPETTCATTLTNNYKEARQHYDNGIYSNKHANFKSF